MSTTADTAAPTDIAVIGYHGRFPGASSVEALWDVLMGDRSARRTPDRATLEREGVPTVLINDPAYVPAVYRMDGGDCFDARFFGYSPREAKAIDPQQRVLLECGWNALEHAGHATGRPLNAGVYAGCSLNTYILATGQADEFVHNPVFTLMSSDKDFLATRLAFKLQLEGPAITVQSACSTSLVAVHTACQALLAQECDMALAGGSCVKVPLDAGYLHRDGGILSPDGECRPFDAAASGTVFGSGVALVVLRRLADAEADGDTIHAVIKATAVNNDGGRKSSYTAPSVEGIADAIRQAIDYAGIPAEAIGYVECHGTGTALGDPVEVQAMVRAFAGLTSREGYCAIGSVKGHIGHLEGAAGIAGLIKAIACLQHRHLPATLHFTKPSAHLPLAGSPFHVNPRARFWESAGHPRTALVNSLGVGGTNAAAIVREAAAPIRHETACGWHVLPISAKSAAQRDALRDAVVAALPGDAAALADAAFTLDVGRARLPFRTALIVRAGGVVHVVGNAAKGIGRPPPLVFVGTNAAAERFWTLLDVQPAARIVGGEADGEAKAILERSPGAVFLLLANDAAADLPAPTGGPPVRVVAPTEGDADAAADDDDAPPALLRQAAELWCAGVPVRLSRLYAGETRRRVPMPLMPFARERHWWGD